MVFYSTPGKSLISDFPAAAAVFHSILIADVFMSFTHRLVILSRLDDEAAMVDDSSTRSVGMSLARRFNAGSDQSFDLVASATADIRSFQGVANATRTHSRPSTRR
jgi:hypothetical protein